MMKNMKDENVKITPLSEESIPKQKGRVVEIILQITNLLVELIEEVWKLIIGYDKKIKELERKGKQNG